MEWINGNLNDRCAQVDIRIFMACCKHSQVFNMMLAQYRRASIWLISIIPIMMSNILTFGSKSMKSTFHLLIDIFD